MIPIYKLDKLPRMQRLRKIAKYFSMAEKRLNDNCTANENADASKIFTFSEFEFFYNAAKLLANDDKFPKEAKKIFEEGIAVFENAMISNNEPAACYLLPATSTNNPSPLSLVPCPYSTKFARALNNIKHLLLSETGKDQADWDFTVANGSISCGAILDSAKRKVFNGMRVYLEDIRSPFNIGAMFRTAESFGVEKMILSPFCADPRHRRAERTAMGCIDIVPWERRELFAPNERQMDESQAGEPQTQPLPVFALETGGVPITEFPFPARGIMIAGSEELGVSPRALEAADASLGRVSIPIYGAKASLNVSTAFGIALQAWAERLNRGN